MKIALALFLAAISALSYADELSDCKCWTGYEPKKDQDGVVKCYGVRLLLATECNVPQRPRCECSGDVTGILSDDSGIWCATNKVGLEQKRWACENQDEWDKFYEQYPNEKH